MLDNVNPNKSIEFGSHVKIGDLNSKSWAGHNVTVCPRCSTDAYYYTQFALGILTVLSIGSLCIGSIYKDTMSYNQKIIVSSVGGTLTFVSAAGFFLNYMVFKKLTVGSS